MYDPEAVSLLAAISTDKRAVERERGARAFNRRTKENPGRRV